MAGYLYSSSFASAVLSNDLKLVERLDHKDPIRSSALLSKGEWLPEEEELIKKHSPDCFIGFKSKKKEGISLTQNVDKLSSAVASLGGSSPFRAPNLAITKKAMKDSVGDDLLIMHSVASIESMTKATNLLIKRLREWYELYNPEYSKTISDHQTFVEQIIAKSRDELLMQAGINKHGTMGADLPESDVRPILEMAKKIAELYSLKALEEEYLKAKMEALCPNLTAIAGYMIGGKLIGYAGSMKRLSEMPSSTIQLLGAEKALFRHITRNSLPPKYGVLHEHPLISKARKQDHGKVARLLADKISIACRVDYFKGEFVGDKLNEDIRKRLA